MTTSPKGRTMRSHTLAAIVSTAALALLTLAGCSTDPEPTATDPTPTSDSSNTAPTEEPGEPQASTAPPSESPEEPDLTTVPAYFVGETPQGPRLYREFQRVTGDPSMEAFALLAAGKAADPDYLSFVPEGGPSSVEHDEGAGLIVVELPDDGWTTPTDGMDEVRAELAVQQIVYTLQGVAQSRDPVEFRLGGAATRIFGIDSAGGIGHGDPLETLALVSVTTPEEGATVSGSFSASGVASSFEATVPWEIRRGDTVVERGFSTAEGWMDKLYPWATDVDVSGLAPGEYQFVAMTDDPSGGEGGGPHEDSKTITVE